MLLFLPTRPGNWFLFQAATSAWPAAAAGPGQVAVCLLYLMARLMEHETTVGTGAPRCPGLRGVQQTEAAGWGQPGSWLRGAPTPLLPSGPGQSTGKGGHWEARGRCQLGGRAPGHSPAALPWQEMLRALPFMPKESRGGSGPQFPFSIKSAGPCSP